MTQNKLTLYKASKNGCTLVGDFEFIASKLLSDQPKITDQIDILLKKLYKETDAQKQDALRKQISNKNHIEKIVFEGSDILDNYLYKTTITNYASGIRLAQIMMLLLNELSGERDVY